MNDYDRKLKFLFPKNIFKDSFQQLIILYCNLNFLGVKAN